jgi:hypothetical protein
LTEDSLLADDALEAIEPAPGRQES